MPPGAAGAKRVRATLLRCPASGRVFSEALMLGLPVADPDAGLWWFDDIPHRLISVQALARAPLVGQLALERLSGDHRFAVLDRMPEHTVMVMTIAVQPQDAVRNHLTRVERQLRRLRRVRPDGGCRPCLAGDGSRAPLLPKDMADALGHFCTQGTRRAFLQPARQALARRRRDDIRDGHSPKDSYEDKLAVAYVSLMNHIHALVERCQYEGRPTIVLTDEGHLITTNPLLAPYVVHT